MEAMTLANWSAVEPRDWRALDFDRASTVTCAHGVALVEDCTDCFLASLAGKVYADGGECDL